MSYSVIGRNCKFFLQNVVRGAVRKIDLKFFKFNQTSEPFNEICNARTKVCYDFVMIGMELDRKFLFDCCEKYLKIALSDTYRNPDSRSLLEEAPNVRVAIVCRFGYSD